MIELFDDQDLFCSKIESKMQSVKRFVAQLPTGGGKTVVFSNIANNYWKEEEKPVLISVHRQELLDQTRNTLFKGFGIQATPIVAGMKYIPYSEVYVGMVESTYKRSQKLPDIGLHIVDECHIGVFDKLQRELEEAKTIGFSATPISSNKHKPLKLWYDDVVCGAQISELINYKPQRLCQNLTYSPKDIVDRSTLAVRGDDFNEDLMAQSFSRPKYVHNTVAAYKKYGAEGTKTIVFNCNCAHNDAVAEAFVQEGYNAKVLDRTTPKHMRKIILHWFETTPDAILCNVGIATTGFDEPTVQTVIINRATMQMSFWLQMCGRGGRIILPFKRMFTIIDMGGNALIHGDWCQDRNWENLFWNPPKPGKGGVPPCKRCINDECDAIIFAGLRTCPICGAEQPKGKGFVEGALGDLVLVTKHVNVNKLIEENTQHKQYYSFYLIGRNLAEITFKMSPVITDEIAKFALDAYLEHVKIWVERVGKKYNDYHKNLAAKFLFTELKQKCPKWQSKIFVDNEYIQD